MTEFHGLADWAYEKIKDEAAVPSPIGDLVPTNESIDQILGAAIRAGIVELRVIPNE